MGPGVTVIRCVLEHPLSTYCMPDLAQLRSERVREGEVDQGGPVPDTGKVGQTDAGKLGARGSATCECGQSQDVGCHPQNLWYISVLLGLPGLSPFYG